MKRKYEISSGTTDRGERKRGGFRVLQVRLHMMDSINLWVHTWDMSALEDGENVTARPQLGPPYYFIRAKN